MAEVMVILGTITYSLAVEHPGHHIRGLGLIEAINNKTTLKIMPEEKIKTWLKPVLFSDNFNYDNYQN